MIVNAAYHLTGRDVPTKADVAFVDPFFPSFYGFINDSYFWRFADMQPQDYALGNSPSLPDPRGTPEWNFRPRGEVREVGPNGPFRPIKRERIAMVGNSLAERMNLFGHFETLLQTRFPDQEMVFRNFGWPADEVGNQQRPSNYTTIDDPLTVFAPDLFLCFFGFNESFAGREPAQIEAFVAAYRQYIKTMSERFTKNRREPLFMLVSPVAFEASGNPLQPDGVEQNKNLEAYSEAIAKLAREDGHRFIDLFAETSRRCSLQNQAPSTPSTGRT